MELIINSALFIPITLMAIFGVLVHDSQINGVIALAIPAPAIVTELKTGTTNLSRTDLHPLSEISTFSGNTHNVGFQPAAQPRNENDKKYITQKRLLGNSFGSEFLWPSI